MGTKEAPIHLVGRGIPLEQVEGIRESVERGVKEVVEPFLRRVRAQSKIPNTKRRY